MDREEMQAINDYLIDVVKHDCRCQECELNHNGICFFAFDCITNNHIHFLELEND